MQNQMRALRYNSEQEHLTIPEYGRHIQNLVDYAVTIENPKEREAAAYQLIRLMAQVSNQGKPTQDIELKLWRHLFIISDYKIDVVPEGIELPKVENKNMKPAPMAYPRNTKRFRHYGGYIQELITKALEEEDVEKRKGFFSNIASYMKTAYKVWNRDPNIGDEVIITDLKAMIGGRGALPEDLNIVAANVTIAAQKPINAGLNRRRGSNSGKRKNTSNNNRDSNRRRKNR
jgi:hypothetical protein